MSDRLTDAELDEIAVAIDYSYHAGTYPPALSARARKFLGPDGGHLALLEELRAERQRNEQSVNPETRPDTPPHAAVVHYLAAHGWSSGQPGPSGTLWSKGGTRIGVPHDPDEFSIQQVLRRLADAEQLSLDAAAAAVYGSGPIRDQDSSPDRASSLAIDTEMARLRDDFASLARLALSGRSDDVIMFVRRCAHRYRNTSSPLAAALRELVHAHPGAPLRGASPRD